MKPLYAEQERCRKRVEAHIAALRAWRKPQAVNRGAGAASGQATAKSPQCLADQLGLLVSVECEGAYAGFERFVEAFNETLDTLPEHEHALLAERWRANKPMIRLATRLGGGQRSAYDPVRDSLHFSYADTQHLSDRLLRETIADELASAVRAAGRQPKVSAEPSFDPKAVIDGRPLAERLGLRIKVSVDDPDAFPRFVDTLAEVFEKLPPMDRHQLKKRWRNEKTTMELLPQMDNGLRSHYDAEADKFAFDWNAIAHLPPDLLRAAIVIELAHAVLALQEKPATQSEALQLSMRWGLAALPR